MSEQLLNLGLAPLSQRNRTKTSRQPKADRGLEAVIEKLMAMCHNDAHVRDYQSELKRQSDAELMTKYCDNWFKSLAGCWTPEGKV